MKSYIHFHHQNKEGLVLKRKYFSEIYWCPISSQSAVKIRIWEPRHSMKNLATNSAVAVWVPKEKSLGGKPSSTAFHLLFSPAQSM